jgi:predicted helicase
LRTHTLDDAGFVALSPEAPHYFFAPKDWSGAEEYNTGFSVQEMFPVSSSGVKTHHDGELISFAPFKSEHNRRMAYRPFDDRYINYDLKKVVRHRFAVMRHMFKENVVLVCSRQVRSFPDWQHVFVADAMFDMCLTSSQTSESSYGFPLFVYDDMHGKRPNLDEAVIARVAAIVMREPDPLALFDYVYAVLHDPAYRARYREFLKIDFPRIPYPASAEEFDRLAAIGGRLRRLHLMEEIPPLTTTFPAEGSCRVEAVKYKDGRVYINGTQYFGNVPQVAWEFYIGGYQPAQKWLKDRKGRVLLWEEIQHYERIIAVLTATEEMMTSITSTLP